jgi:ABC-2 type transport system permease protein
LVEQKMGAKVWLYRLNPITPIVLIFQRAIYNHVPGVLPSGVNAKWYLGQIAPVIVFSAVLFVVALRVFGRLEGNFAEEL